MLNYRDYTRMLSDIAEGQMLCVGRVVNLMHHVLQASVLTGDMAEFGCHMGRTAVLMAHLSAKPLWLYDSFQGLPSRSLQDEAALTHFKQGHLTMSRSKLDEYFKKYAVRSPAVYEGWFNSIPVDKLPEQLCFAHLDGDLYESIRDSIRLVYPRLVKGGVCLIDDYGWTGLAGVKNAVDEYMKDKLEPVQPLVTGSKHGFQAVIVKL